MCVSLSISSSSVGPILLIASMYKPSTAMCCKTESAPESKSAFAFSFSACIHNSSCEDEEMKVPYPSCDIFWCLYGSDSVSFLTRAKSEGCMDEA